jgi:hypothetical protein
VSERRCQATVDVAGCEAQQGLENKTREDGGVRKRMSQNLHPPEKRL